MTDLTESRISEIRETIAAASPGPWYFTLVEADEGNVRISHEHWDLWRQELEPEVLRSEPGVLEAKLEPRCVNVGCLIAEAPDMHLIANSRAFLEALLAEREGMKAEIDKQRDELASYAEEREMLRIIFGCPERARRIMSTLDSLRDRLSAPLDPSSAPSEESANEAVP